MAKTLARKKSAALKTKAVKKTGPKAPPKQSAPKNATAKVGKAGGSTSTSLAARPMAMER